MLRMVLIAAGGVLRGDQHQPRMTDSRLGLSCAPKGGENTEDYGISGENANSNGCDDGDEENHGHEKRDHNQSTLSEFNFRLQ